MASISLVNLSARYGKLLVVDDVSLEIASGEFVVLLGPSGCGKTTTLRMIAGFVQPATGKILLDQSDVTALPPRKRDVGMVFQNYALFPTMTAAENIGFPLKQRKVHRKDIARRVSELIDLVQLNALGDSYPAELSGGQQQRVALARALASSPKLLLMDEPLGALDQKLRDNLQLELHRIQRDLGITTVLVTHDQQEAMLFADRIVIMSDGRIQQVGTPTELYRKPVNQFVADFIGKSNIVVGKLAQAGDGHVLRSPAGASFAVGATAAGNLGRDALVVIRPEDILLSPAGSRSNALASGVVERRLFLGNITQYFVRLTSGELWQVEQHSTSGDVAKGDRVDLSWNVERTPILFDKAMR